MARRPRLVDFTPDDFFIGDEGPVDVAVIKAVSVRAGKLPRGAYGRIKARPHVEAEVRAEVIAGRADRTTGARIADDRRQQRLARKLLAKGKIDSGVVSATDYQSYVQRLMHDMYSTPDFEKRQLAARDFFSLLGMARLPEALEERLSKTIFDLSAAGLLQLTRCCAAANVEDVLPTSAFLRTLYRVANPSALMPVETTMEVLSILSRRGQGYKSQESFFEGLFCCAKSAADRLAEYENRHKQDAPVSWTRPGDILVFCRAMSGEPHPAAQAQRQRKSRRQGVPRTTAADIPLFDRPDVAPLAKKVVADIDHLVRCFPSRRQRRRFRCIRRSALIALKQAQIVNEESLVAVAPEPKPRRVLRRRAAINELAERRQP